MPWLWLCQGWSDSWQKSMTMKKYYKEDAFVHPLKKGNLKMILTLQLYSPSITDKIPRDLLQLHQDPASALKYMQKYVYLKKNKKGKQSPHTKTWVSFKDKLFVAPAPEAAEAAGLFQWERACIEGCKASTLPDQGQSEHTRE